MMSGEIWMSEMQLSSGRRGANVGSEPSSCVKTDLKYEFDRLALSVSFINSLSSALFSGAMQE